jgi:hypothetical protein
MPNMARQNDDQRNIESKRILDRLESETENSGLLGGAAKRLESHLGAKDADQNDWAEVWGSRIGRSIGAVVVIILFLYLWNYLMSPV